MMYESARIDNKNLAEIFSPRENQISNDLKFEEEEKKGIEDEEKFEIRL